MDQPNRPAVRHDHHDPHTAPQIPGHPRTRHPLRPAHHTAPGRQLAVARKIPHRPATHPSHPLVDLSPRATTRPPSPRDPRRTPPTTKTLDPTRAASNTATPHHHPSGYRPPKIPFQRLTSQHLQPIGALRLNGQPF